MAIPSRSPGQVKQKFRNVILLRNTFLWKYRGWWHFFPALFLFPFSSETCLFSFCLLIISSLFLCPFSIQRLDFFFLFLIPSSFFSPLSHSLSFPPLRFFLLFLISSLFFGRFSPFFSRSLSFLVFNYLASASPCPSRVMEDTKARRADAAKKAIGLLSVVPGVFLSVRILLNPSEFCNKGL